MTPDRQALRLAGKGLRAAYPVVTLLMDTLALLLVLLVLLAPNELSQLTPGTFVSVPVELLLGVAVLVLLPPNARSAAATIFGVALGLLALMKLLDMGFFAFFARPFDPVLDWGLLDDGMRFLAGAIGAY